MKKFITALLIVAGLAAVMTVTCPDKQQHKDVLQAVVDEIINENISGDDTGLGYLAFFLGSKLINITIDSILHVDNYFILSIGRLDLPDGESKKVSLGILGHIFTVDKETALRIIEEEIK